MHRDDYRHVRSRGNAAFDPYGKRALFGHTERRRHVDALVSSDSTLDPAPGVSGVFTDPLVRCRTRERRPGHLRATRSRSPPHLPALYRSGKGREATYGRRCSFSPCAPPAAGRPLLLADPRVRVCRRLVCRPESPPKHQLFNHERPCPSWHVRASVRGVRTQLARTSHNDVVDTFQVLFVNAGGTVKTKIPKYTRRIHLTAARKPCVEILIKSVLLNRTPQGRRGVWFYYRCAPHVYASGAHARGHRNTKVTSERQPAGWTPRARACGLTQT